MPALQHKDQLACFTRCEWGSPPFVGNKERNSYALRSISRSCAQAHSTRYARSGQAFGREE